MSLPIKEADIQALRERLGKRYKKPVPLDMKSIMAQGDLREDVTAKFNEYEIGLRQIAFTEPNAIPFPDSLAMVWEDLYKHRLYVLNGQVEIIDTWTGPTTKHVKYLAYFLIDDRYLATRRYQ